MNIPIEIIAGVLVFLLGAVLNNQRSTRRRIDLLEKKILTVIVMLCDRGFRIPETDTDLLKKNGLTI